MGSVLPWLVMAGVMGFFWYMRRPSVSADEAHRMVADGALLVDVRSPGEFSGGHLPGARNVPVQELGRRLGELGKKDGAIVLYCASGMRSASAASTLKREGFTRVYNLGAMNNW